MYLMMARLAASFPVRARLSIATGLAWNADGARSPRAEPFLKGLEVERGENVAERVVRRRSRPEPRKPPQQRQLHLPEALGSP